MKIHFKTLPFSTFVFLACAVLAPLGVTSSGCAHNSPEENRFERRIAAEPEIKDKAALDSRNDRTIENASGITDIQRQKLTQLRDTSRAQMRELQEESFKIRSLLVQDMIDPEVKTTEINTLKTKLKNTENKKLAIYFESVDQANTVLGRQNYPVEQRERIIRDLMEPRAPRAD